MHSRPLLAVVLDYGASSPFGIARSARGLCDVMFVCDRRLPYVRKYFEDARAIGRVCDVTDLDDGQAEQCVAEAGPDAVHTFSDPQLARTAALAQACGALRHGPGTIAAITDKLAQRRALTDAKVQSIRFRPVATLADLLRACEFVGLPAVLKPRRGVGSRNTAVALTPSDAERHWRNFHDGPSDLDGGYLLEEFLAGDPTVAGECWGDYVSVESVVSGSAVFHTGVVGRLPLWPPLNEAGVFLPSTLDFETQEAVCQLAGRAIAALGIRFGGVHTEIKLTSRGPEIIEVNGRTGGHVSDLIQRSTGFDQVRAAIRTVIGLDPQVPSLRHSTCAYRYFLAPPRDALRLLSLDGIDEVERLPGVAYFERDADVGAALDWRFGTRNHLGIVCGSVPDHSTLLATIRAINQTFRARYAFD